MENKHVGYLVLGISTLIGIIVFLFNNAMNQFLDASCNLAGHTSCVMHDTLKQQTYLSLAIVGILVVIGLVLIFNKPDERIVIRKIKDKKIERKIDTSKLRSDEKQALKIIQENRAVFQSDLIERTGFGKAKMTRIIDRLEGMGLVERKRRGMTNVVVLKEN